MPAEGRSVYFVTGPTGSGKTNFAVRLASELNAVVVPMDQLQLYRSLEIGVGLNLEVLSGVETVGYQTLDPGTVFPPTAYVSWLTRIVSDLPAGRAVVVEGGCTSYLKELLRTREDNPVFRRAQILSLVLNPDAHTRARAVEAHYSLSITGRIVAEMSELTRQGYYRPAGLSFFAECERLFEHSERPDSALAWALRISARIYYPALLVLLGQLQIEAAAKRIRRNVLDIQEYQAERIAGFCRAYPGVIRALGSCEDWIGRSRSHPGPAV